MTQYQGLLCENLQVKLEVVRTLNLATFLPDVLGPPDHNCLEVLDEVFSSRPDLTDKPLQNPDLVLYIVGCSFIEDGKRMARHAVISDLEVMEAEVFPQGSSAQRAELRSLISGQELSQDHLVNIYTNSWYVFGT